MRTSWEGYFLENFRKQPGYEQAYVSSRPQLARVSPVDGATRKHAGVDIAFKQKAGAAIVSPVYCVCVRLWVDDATTGNGGVFAVPIGGGILLWEFMHARDRLKLSVGDAIEAGQTLGYVGTTGRSTGPHLHLGVALVHTFGEKSHSRIYLDPSQVEVDVGDVNDIDVGAATLEGFGMVQRQWPIVQAFFTVEDVMVMKRETVAFEDCYVVGTDTVCDPADIQPLLDEEMAISQEAISIVGPEGPPAAEIDPDIPEDAPAILRSSPDPSPLFGMLLRPLVAGGEQ